MATLEEQVIAAGREMEKNNLIIQYFKTPFEDEIYEIPEKHDFGVNGSIFV